MFNKLEELEERIKGLGKWEKAAVLVFLFAFGIRLAYYQHGLWIDEGNQLDKARDLLKGDFQIRRRPFHYFLLLFSLVISGFSTFAAELLVILMGSGTVFLVFLIGREIFNEKVGLFSSILLATQPLHWFLSEKILSDVPVVFMLSLSFYLFLRSENEESEKKLYAAAVVFALAVLTKVSALVGLGVIGAYMLLKNKDDLSSIFEKKYLITALVVGLIIGGWVLVSYLLPSEGYFLQTGIARLTKVREASKEMKTRAAHPDKLYYLKNLHNILRLPLTLVFLLGVFTLFLTKFKNALFPTLWFLVFLAVSSFLEVKVPRYLLPLMPAVCLIGGFGLDKVRRDLGPDKKEVMLAIGIILFVVSAFQFFLGSRMIRSKAQGFIKLDEAGKWLRQHTSKKEEIIAASVGQIRWFSDRKCYGSNTFANKTKFFDLVEQENVTYLELDTWEIRMREPDRKWVFSYVKEHNKTFIPVKAFAVDNQPVIVIYRINK